MPPRNRKGAVGPLSEAVRQQISQLGEPARREPQQVFRGLERYPILSVEAPGMATTRTKAAQLVRECARRRNLTSDIPAAVRIHTTAHKGYLLGEPLAVFDQMAADQYELRWNAQATIATVNLLDVLQPRNLEVAEGFITEIPVTLDTFNNQAYILIHLVKAETRVREEGPPRKQKSTTPPNPNPTPNPDPNPEPQAG